MFNEFKGVKMIYTASNTKKWTLCKGDIYMRGGKIKTVYYFIPYGAKPQKGKEAEELPAEYEIYETAKKALPLVRKRVD